MQGNNRRGKSTHKLSINGNNIVFQYAQQPNSDQNNLNLQVNGLPGNNSNSVVLPHH